MPASLAASIALSAIRLRTAPSHRRLESRLGFLVDEGLRADTYRRLLAGLLGFHAPLEDRLSQHAEGLSGLGLDLKARRKADWLRRDLQILGLSAAAQNELPHCEAPRLRSSSEAIGCLYVTEGATLGGRIISEALARSLKIGPQSGAAFFSGHGEATAQRWREMLAAISTLSEAEVEPAVAGAAATFDGLESWLDAQGCLS